MEKLTIVKRSLLKSPRLIFSILMALLMMSVLISSAYGDDGFDPGYGYGNTNVTVASVDLTGKITSDGVLTQPVNLTNTDSPASINIPEGTRCLGANGEAPNEIVVMPVVSPPPPPEETDIILAVDFGPDGTTFDPPITITVDYDPALLGEGVSQNDLVLAYYDVESGQWVTLQNIVVDSVTHTVSATVSHFTQFAVIAPEPVGSADGGGFQQWYIILLILGSVLVFTVIVYGLGRNKTAKYKYW